MRFTYLHKMTPGGSYTIFGATLIALTCISNSMATAQETGSLTQAQSPSSASSGSPSLAKVLNPDISLDGLFGASQFSTSDPLTFEGGHDPKVNGFQLQNLELTLGAAVDPYFRGDSNIVLVQEDGEIKVEVEEAYLTSLDLPWNLQLKAGTFFSALGRHNQLHPHAWDFANKPLVLGRMFGGDGLRNPGVQISWLTPLPWYSELIASAQNSTGETAASFRPERQMRALSDAVALVRLNNFFELSEEFSLNLGGSFATGPNAEADDRMITKIVGGDLYLKYRQPSSLSFIYLQAEALKRFYGTTTETLADWGWYTQIMYRLGEPFQRWHIGARYDWVSDKLDGSPNTSPGEVDPATGEPTDRDLSKRFRVSPVIAFYPSEFSKFRLQYDYDKPNALGRSQQMVALQWEFLIGAHGAHKF